MRINRKTLIESYNFLGRLRNMQNFIKNKHVVRIHQRDECTCEIFKKHSRYDVNYTLLNIR